MRIIKSLLIGVSAAAIALVPCDHAITQENVSPGKAVEGNLNNLKEHQRSNPAARLGKSGSNLRSAFGCFWDGSQIDPRAVETTPFPWAGDIGKIKSYAVSLVRALSLAGFRKADIEEKLRPVFSRYGCNPDFVSQAMASSRSGHDIGGIYISFAPVLMEGLPKLGLATDPISNVDSLRQGIIVDDEETKARTVVSFEDIYDPGAICRDTNLLLYNEPGICAQNRERYERYATGQYTLFDYCEAQAAGIDPRAGMGLAASIGITIVITGIGIGVSWYLDHRAEIRKNNAELNFQRDLVNELKQDLVSSRQKIIDWQRLEIASGGFVDTTTQRNKEAARQANIESDLKEAEAKVERLEKELNIRPPDDESFDYESLRVCLESPAMQQSFEQSMQAARRLSLSCRGDLIDTRIVDPEQPHPSDRSETVMPRSQCNVADLQAHLGNLVSEIEREDIRTELEAAAEAAARTRAERWANAQCPRCSSGERCVRDEDNHQYICEAVDLDLEVDKLPNTLRTIIQQELDKFERDFQMQEEAWQRQMGRSPEIIADPHNQRHVWQHFTLDPTTPAGGPRSLADDVPPRPKGGDR